MKYIGLITGFALSVFLMSCDRSDELSGSGVVVQIRSLALAEEGGEDVMRSASGKGIGRVSTPIGDGLLLEMSMERDESPLRATLPLTTGAYFRVIAVEAGTSKYVSHGDFTVGGATTDNNFLVTSYSSYDFICISYNDAVNPLPSFVHTRGDLLTETLTGDIDALLWWKQTGVPVTTSGPALSITLNYVVAKVKVMVDCSYNGWEITGIDSGVTLGSVTTGEETDLVSGVVSGTTGDRPITWPAMNVITPTQQTSDPLPVLAKGSGTITVTLPKNVVKRKDFQPIPTTEGTYALKGNFTTALEAGKSYTLRVKLRAPKWAGSNIYWDGSRLTFDPYQEDGSLATRKGYEGVYFRFGSLVGISPVGDFDGSTVVYIPDNSQATKWRASTAGGEGYEEWKRVPANLSPDKEQIPYMDNENYPAGNFDRSDSYVIDAFQGDPALMYPELRGDICQYLSKTGAVSGSDVYRLPTSTEFGTEFEVWDASNPIAGGWKVGGTESDAVGMGSDPGTYDMIAGGFLYSWNSTMGNVTLSSSGFRDCDTGILEFRGYRGSYWSGSAASNTRAYHLYFSVISMRPTVDAERSYGFSVRCVKN